MAQGTLDNLKLGMDTLRAHKLRSFLAVLGIVIGVGVVMIVVAIIQGFRQQVVDSISSLVRTQRLSAALIRVRATDAGRKKSANASRSPWKMATRFSLCVRQSAT
jgi:ABC-type antimicrobial peptide transport system permease subunit